MASLVGWGLCTVRAMCTEWNSPGWDSDQVKGQKLGWFVVEHKHVWRGVRSADL